MTKKLLCLFLTLPLVLAAVCMPSAAFAEDTIKADKTYLLTDFNDLSWDGIGNGSNTAYNNDNGIGSILVGNWDKHTSLTAKDAPSGKDLKYNLSSEENDKSLCIEYVDAAAGNFYLYRSLSIDEDSIFKISFNFYVEAVNNSSHALISCDLRSTDGGNNSQLFSLRHSTSNGLQINGGSANSLGYKLRTWYNIEFQINTDTKKFTCYLDGVALANFTDVSLSNQNLTFANGANTKLSQIRFQANRTTLTGDKFYLDDMFMGLETKQPAPEFFKSVNASGEKGDSQTNIKKGMKAVEIRFEDAMNPSYLTDYIKVLNNGSPVSFTGSLSEDKKIYTIEFDKKIYPNSTIVIQFEKGIRTNTNFIYREDYEITLTTESVSFGVADIYFTADEFSDEHISFASKTSPNVCANADVVYDNTMTEPQSVTLLVGAYQENDGRLYLADLDFKKVTINVPTNSGAVTARIALPFTDLDFNLDTSYKFGVFVWDDILNKNPLSGISFINVINEL